MEMEYIHAAAMLHDLDNEINEENMKAVLTAAGADVSESRVKALIAALEDVDIEEEIATASAEMAPGGGSAAAVTEGEGGEEADETLPETADDQSGAEDAGGEESGDLDNLFSGGDES